MAPLDGVTARKKKSYNMIRREARQLDDSDQALVLELAKAGLYAYKIAVKFDVTARRIKEICKAAGVDLMSRENQRDKKAKKILELLTSGKTAEQIMAQIDCDRETIAQVRRRNGLPIQPSKAQVRAQASARHAMMLVSDGLTIKDACQIVRISTETYSKYRKLWK